MYLNYEMCVTFDLANMSSHLQEIILRQYNNRNSSRITVAVMMRTADVYQTLTVCQAHSTLCYVSCNPQNYTFKYVPLALPFLPD